MLLLKQASEEAVCAAGWKDDVDDAIHASHGHTVRHECPYKTCTTSRAPADPESLIGKRGQCGTASGVSGETVAAPRRRRRVEDPGTDVAAEAARHRKKGAIGSLSNANQRSSDYRPRIRARRGDTMDTTMMPRDCCARECAW